MLSFCMYWIMDAGDSVNDSLVTTRVSMIRVLTLTTARKTLQFVPYADWGPDSHMMNYHPLVYAML